MSGKIIEISCQGSFFDSITAMAETHSATILSRYRPTMEGGKASFRLFVEIENVQPTLDRIQSILPTSSKPLILLGPIEAQVGGDESLVDSEFEHLLATREELFSNISKGTKLDRNFILLAILATIVASIGISENNVAVVIGAMVIAPLLGPNLGLALGAVLGDKELIKSAIITNGVGLTITIAISALIAVIWSPNMDSYELLSRTQVQTSSIVLALASGVAAVVLLTSRLPNALVGVMVAVALAPPASVFGMMLGTGYWTLASNAGLLLLINVVAVNFSAQLVFLIRGIRPRTWLAKRAAKQSVYINIAT
ncbi:MAG: putative hydrophobic protein (TIGR00341 family) [Arenicella sp.]|jgi:uncharacterized hydrophobic protein (TIGR00341 family)